MKDRRTLDLFECVYKMNTLTCPGSPLGRRATRSADPAFAPKPGRSYVPKSEVRWLRPSSQQATPDHPPQDSHLALTEFNTQYAGNPMGTFKSD